MDGARQFYLSLNEELSKLGCTQSILNPAVYILKSDKLHDLICCHVHNNLNAGDQKLDIIMTKLCQRFIAGKVEEKMFNYIPVKANQGQDYSRPYRIYSCIRKPHYAHRKSTTEARLSRSRGTDHIQKSCRPNELDCPKLQTRYGL